MNEFAQFLGSASGAAIVALASAALLVLFQELGLRYARRQLARYGNGARTGVGDVDAAVYSLFALLIGFSFSGAAVRFENRRHSLIAEASGISTAWQRLDLLPPPARDSLRSDMQRYVDALLAIHQNAVHTPTGRELDASLTHAQDAMWKMAVAACTIPSGEQARILVLPSLNEMFDAVDAERAARLVHPPLVVYVMLGLTAIATALFAGYAMGDAPTRNWLFILGIAATIAIASFGTLELEYPHLGLVRIDRSDRVIEELRGWMK